MLENVYSKEEGQQVLQLLDVEVWGKLPPKLFNQASPHLVRITEFIEQAMNHAPSVAVTQAQSSQQ